MQGGEAFAVMGGVAERDLGGAGALQEEPDVVLVGHADAAVHLDGLVRDKMQRFGGARLGQRCEFGDSIAAAVKRIASVGYVRSNLYVLNGRTAGNVAIAEEALAAGLRPNELTDGPAVALASNAQAAVVGVALGEASSSAFGFAREAKLKGFEGDACPECGNFTMVRNGTCLKCTTCGGTTGCS